MKRPERWRTLLHRGGVSLGQIYDTARTALWHPTHHGICSALSALTSRHTHRQTQAGLILYTWRLMWEGMMAILIQICLQEKQSGYARWYMNALQMVIINTTPFYRVTYPNWKQAKYYNDVQPLHPDWKLCRFLHRLSQYGKGHCMFNERIFIWWTSTFQCRAIDSIIFFYFESEENLPKSMPLCY